MLQTGAQILTGLLLDLAFPASFAELGTPQRVLYLGLAGLAALRAVVAIARVALHRAVFHLRDEPTLVRVAHDALRGALALVSLLLVGAVAFVFDVVVGLVASGVVLGVVILVLWTVVPRIVRHRRRGRAR
ncbi:DUF6328 family protein [Microbacterium testaceum]|uniref:DUF6328 family protein n=1 Tax=Microbacterium testaceum TaxID=2033 RepID=UPI0021563C0F|nr:DUF6328 family protein [Microbacterium testaceum]